MKDISLSDWLTYLSVIIGIAGIWLAWHFHRKSIRAKLLAYATTEAIPVVLAVQGITVRYLERELTALSRVFLLLWNRGTAPIEASDFVQPISIINAEQVLRLEVVAKDAAANVTANADTKSIVIDLLRPNEAALFQIDAGEENYRPNLSVQMKSADMSVPLGQTLLYLPLTLPVVLGLAAFWLMISFSEDISLISSNFTIAIAGGVFVVMVAVLVGLSMCAGYYLARGIVKVRAPPVVLRYLAVRFAVISLPRTVKTLKSALELTKPKV